MAKSNPGKMMEKETCKQEDDIWRAWGSEEYSW